MPIAVEACGQYGKLTCLVQLPAKKFAPTAMPNVPFLKSADGMFGALFRLNNCDVGAPRPLENIVWKKFSVCKSPGLLTTILPEDVWIVGVLEPANRFNMPYPAPLGPALVPASTHSGMIFGSAFLIASAAGMMSFQFFGCHGRAIPAFCKMALS